MRDVDEVKGWLKKAETDFHGAIDIQRRRKNPLPDLVCYHSQQAAEKYLKAFLIYYEKPFPKTHDLMLLLEMCVKHESALELHKELFEILNPYSVQFRYPGDEARLEEARLAMKAIKRIRKIFTGLLPESLFENQ